MRWDPSCPASSPPARVAAVLHGHTPPAPDSCPIVCPDRGVNSVLRCRALRLPRGPHPCRTDGVDADRGTRTMRYRGRGYGPQPVSRSALGVERPAVWSHLQVARRSNRTPRRHPPPTAVHPLQDDHCRQQARWHRWTPVDRHIHVRRRLRRVQHLTVYWQEREYGSTDRQDFRVLAPKNSADPKIPNRTGLFILSCSRDFSGSPVLGSRCDNSAFRRPPHYLAG